MPWVKLPKSGQIMHFEGEPPEGYEVVPEPVPDVDVALEVVPEPEPVPSWAEPEPSKLQKKAKKAEANEIA